VERGLLLRSCFYLVASLWLRDGLRRKDFDFFERLNGMSKLMP
jgi:hypothetical protein